MLLKRRTPIISIFFSFLTGYLFGRVNIRRKDEQLPAIISEKIKNLAPKSLVHDEAQCAKRLQRERLKGLKSLTPDLAIAPTIWVSINGIDLNYVAYNSWTVQRARTIKTRSLVP